MTVESKSDYARRKNRSAAAVTQWIKSGLLFGPSIQGKGRSARIVVEVADAQLASRADPGQALGNGRKTFKPDASLKSPKPLKAGPALKASLKAEPSLKEPASLKVEPVDDIANAGEPDPADADPDYAFHKARLAKAQADAQEMKNAVTRGELLIASDVERRWSEIVGDTRSILLAAAGRMRQKFTGMPPEQVAWIDAEHRRALTEMSRVRPPR